MGPKLPHPSSTLPRRTCRNDRVRNRGSSDGPGRPWRNRDYIADPIMICVGDQYCRTAILCRGVSAPDKQLAKGLDFLGDEITERSHTGCSPHVAVKNQIEVQSNHWCRPEQPDKIWFV